MTQPQNEPQTSPPTPPPETPAANAPHSGGSTQYPTGQSNETTPQGHDPLSQAPAQLYGNESQGYGPQQGYGPTIHAFGATQQTYGPTQPGYGPPQQGYGPPQYGPAPQYGYPNQPYPSQPYPAPGYTGYGPPAPQYPNQFQPQKGIFGPDDDAEINLFEDPNIRRLFIRKVYSILMIQLAVTMLIMATFMFFAPIRKFVRQNMWIVYVAIGVNLFTLIALSCCTNVRRKSPMNYIFLGIFTVTEGILLGVIACVVKAEAVLLAIAITMAICLALTLFAFQTKWDFTMMGGILLCCLVVLLLFGIISIFVRNRIMTLVYSCIGALLFSFYLVYDTQLMMGGNHRYAISPDEHIFAALSLYIDVINIFVFILRIITGSTD